MPDTELASLALSPRCSPSYATAAAATHSASLAHAPYRLSSHNFYIPVMGTCFTIDTPLVVAKYGLTAVVSLVDDVLIEEMRKLWCEKLNAPYAAISSQDEDARAKRITAYLDLMQRRIDKQISETKVAPFAPNSEITLYYEMLPDNSELKCAYQNMLREQNEDVKQRLQDKLRQAVVAGNIDVNIMTKIDRQNYRRSGDDNSSADEAETAALPYEFCDAAAALRGFARSSARAMMVFSAGFNPHLYGYTATFDDFFPDENNELKKQICLKVSDFRSAVVQGKYLAKHGLWVSEYRVESPLNCGGHAFINDGHLMGPILEEFKLRKDELLTTMRNLYKSALQNMKKPHAEAPREIRITAQGGIGTNAEHTFLIDNYGLAATGWGTPFLLVPEAINIDHENLQKLLHTTSDDIFLSNSSPLGVPFWNLFNSASEEARRARIAKKTPGSACVKGYIRFNQEFVKLTKKKLPLCCASREYQKIKLEELEKMDLSQEEKELRTKEVTDKSCICHDLAGGATLKYGIDCKATPAICPGPNIVNFKKIMTLKEIVDHIYGRCSLLANNDRPHMFIRELELQISYLTNEIKQAARGWPARAQQKLSEVKENLIHGIKYYQNLVKAKEAFKEQRDSFLQRLSELQTELDNVFLSSQKTTAATAEKA